MTYRMPIALVATSTLLLAGCSGIGTTHPEQPPTPGQSAQPTANAWQQARARGMVFRAVGTDPAWEADLGKGHTPTLFVNINDGAQQFVVPAMTVSADQTTGTIRFRGQAAGRGDVEMDIQRGQCQDSMATGKASAAVTLAIGARALTGCGRFLF